jgi:cytochrome c oxidase subunit 2
MVTPSLNTRAQYHHLATIYLAIGVGVFAFISVLVVAVVVRYRRSPSRSPSRIADAPRLELLYAAVLAATAAVLLVLTFRTEGRTDRAFAAASGNGPTIKVIATKWHWTFVYGGSGPTVTGDNAGHTPTLTVPVNTDVRFVLTAGDVIHSFWIPYLRFKRLAYPAYTSNFELVFPRGGYWRDGGECAEFCGLLHAEMRFNVRVLAAAQFAAWLRRASISGGAVS